MGSGQSTVALPLRAAPARAARHGMLTLGLLALGHFSVDLYTSALSVFQPLLGQKFGLSLTQAGLLAGMMVLSSSVMQPAYGYLSDRFRSRMFTVLAPLVAGVFITALGVAPAYPWLLLMVALGGAGVASFHPQASARATMGVSGNRGRAMAIFISGGSLGMALGPTFFSALCTHLGFERAWWGALPGVVVTLLLYIFLKDAGPQRSKTRQSFDWGPLREVWKPFTILYSLVFIRSIVQVTFAQFIPLYLSRERGYSLADASLTLTAYLSAGAVGGFLGGPVSDRFGGRLVILLSMIGCVPLLAVFLLTQGVVSAVALALGGLVLLFTIPVNVVMAQELVPTQAGTVSALMMGFAWGTAGVVFIPLTGWAADHFSLHRVLCVLILFPVLGFLLTLKLPKEKR